MIDTQSSFDDANRAVTGSSPTGTLPAGRGNPPETSNNSTRASGRLQTASVWSPGASATGCTGAVSKFTKLVMAALAIVQVVSVMNTAKRR
jgi:hypothetical protein